MLFNVFIHSFFLTEVVGEDANNGKKKANKMELNASKNAESLVSICIKQAAELLISAREYYPFAFGIDQNGKIVPVDTYFGEEYPSSIKVILHLEKALAVSHKEHNFTEVSICTNVDLIDDLTKEAHPTIEIRIDSLLPESKFNYYQPYLLGDNITYGEPEVREGTLHFFHT